MLRDVMGWLAIGIAVGILGALAGGRFIKTLLFGLDADDPGRIGLAVAVLALSALLAAWLPAHRAGRIDPMAALRED